MKTFGTRTVIVIVAIFATFFAYYTRLVIPARKAEQRMTCSSNLRQIGSALLNYEWSYKKLPIASEQNSKGDLMRSWRSQIYPTFMQQSPQVYDENFSWDSPENMRLLNGTPVPMGSKGGAITMHSLDRFPYLFCCPSCDRKDRKGINYVVVSGEQTAFPRSSSIELSDIKDGMENTIFVVESINCTPDWTEPYDLDFDTMSFAINAKDRPSISSHHPYGPHICFADGAVFCISEKITEAELKAMLTIAGGENITRDSLIARGVLLGN